MGFGAFGKEVRLHGGGFLQKLGGFVNRITSTLKPVVGIAAGIADKIKPGLGTAIQTGFDVVDGVSGSLKGGGNSYAVVEPTRLAKLNKDWKFEDKGHPRARGRMIGGDPEPSQNLKVDSILNKRLSVPQRAQMYDSDEDTEEVEDSSSD
jgi:hypothetical protein